MTMNSDNLSVMRDFIDKFSLFTGNRPEKEFKDVLIDLATLLRSKDCSYVIQYHRPDSPEFRLRSQNKPDENSYSKSISFLEPGRYLEISVDNLKQEAFDGICSELSVLGETGDENPSLNVEPELNLLMPRTFQAELYAEYQRFERYGSTFFVIGVSVESGDWKTVARELKHQGKSRDTYGVIKPRFVLGLFLARAEGSQLPVELENRILQHLDSDTIDFKALHIPTDVDDWTQLQNKLFDFKEFKESDSVAHNPG